MCFRLRSVVRAPWRKLMDQKNREKEEEEEMAVSIFVAGIENVAGVGAIVVEVKCAGKKAQRTSTAPVDTATGKVNFRRQAIHCRVGSPSLNERTGAHCGLVTVSVRKAGLLGRCLGRGRLAVTGDEGKDGVWSNVSVLLDKGQVVHLSLKSGNHRNGEEASVKQDYLSTPAVLNHDDVNGIHGVEPDTIPASPSIDVPSPATKSFNAVNKNQGPTSPLRPTARSVAKPIPEGASGNMVNECNDLCEIVPDLARPGLFQEINSLMSTSVSEGHHSTNGSDEWLEFITGARRTSVEKESNSSGCSLLKNSVASSDTWLNWIDGSGPVFTAAESNKGCLSRIWPTRVRNVFKCSKSVLHAKDGSFSTMRSGVSSSGVLVGITSTNLSTQPDETVDRYGGSTSHTTQVEPVCATFTNTPSCLLYATRTYFNSQVSDTAISSVSSYAWIDWITGAKQVRTDGEHSDTCSGRQFTTIPPQNEKWTGQKNPLMNSFGSSSLDHFDIGIDTKDLEFRVGMPHMDAFPVRTHGNAPAPEHETIGTVDAHSDNEKIIESNDFREEQLTFIHISKDLNTVDRKFEEVTVCEARKNIPPAGTDCLTDKSIPNVQIPPSTASSSVQGGCITGAAAEEESDDDHGTGDENPTSSERCGKCSDRKLANMDTSTRINSSATLYNHDTVEIGKHGPSLPDRERCKSLSATGKEEGLYEIKNSYISPGCHSSSDNEPKTLSPSDFDHRKPSLPSPLSNDQNIDIQLAQCISSTSLLTTRSIRQPEVDFTASLAGNARGLERSTSSIIQALQARNDDLVQQLVNAKLRIAQLEELSDTHGFLSSLSQ